MQLQLIDLTKVSLNTRVTNEVLNTLNTKLDDAEKRNFLTWLTLVRQHTQAEVQTAERKVQRRGGF